MTSKDGPHSNPYFTAKECCDACVFNAPQHAEWCEKRERDESEFSIQVYPPIGVSDAVQE